MFSKRQTTGPTWSGVLRRWLPWLVFGAALLALSFFADAFFDGWLDQHRSKALSRWARFISRVGDWPALIIGAIAIGAAGAAIRRPCWRIVCLMVLAASLAGLSANVSRSLTGRARPNAKITQGWHGPPIGKNRSFADHATNSFPSAHTTTAMAFFATLLLLAPKIGIWLLPAPLLVGASRFYLGVHHFSDVCAGLLLGTAFAIFTCRFIAPQWPKFRNWWTSLPVGRFPPSSKKVMAQRLPDPPCDLVAPGNGVPKVSLEGGVPK